MVLRVSGMNLTCIISNLFSSPKERKLKIGTGKLGYQNYLSSLLSFFFSFYQLQYQNEPTFELALDL